MATALSVLADSEQPPDSIDRAAEVIAALSRGEAPWLCRAWLSSVGACQLNFAPAARRDAEEAFHELFAATSMDYCGGALITFYCQFDDMIHLTSCTEANEAAYYNDWIHELAHATGHASRLGRDLPHAFGHNVDDREDLTAEIAAAIICLDLGFEPRLRHPECISRWTDLLRREPEALSIALQHAREAAAYLFERRDLQAALFEQWDAAERAREQAEEAVWAAERRQQRLLERGRWALRCAQSLRPGERSEAVAIGLQRKAV